MDEEKAQIREELKKRVDQIKPIADEISYQRFRAGNMLAIVAGILILMVAGYFAWRDYASVASRKAVVGTVSGFDVRWQRKDNKNDSSQISTAIFQFTYDGKTHMVKGSTGSGLNFQPYTAGETVNILVNPSNPNDVIIDTFTDRYMPMTAAGIFGLFFLGWGIKKQFLNK
jgi:hypothetical protein